MLNADDSAAQGELLGEILFNTKSLNATLVVAGEEGVRWNAVGAAARVMKKLEETEHSQGNFRFAAIAMVPPLTPFFRRRIIRDSDINLRLRWNRRTLLPQRSKMRGISGWPDNG